MKTKTQKRDPKINSCLSAEAWSIISSLPHMVLTAQATMRALSRHRPEEWTEDDKDCRDAAIEVIARWNKNAPEEDDERFE
jgi:hypothetical protein